MKKTFKIFDGPTFADCVDVLHQLFDRREKITVTISNEKPRSLDQNAISHVWYQQIALDTGEMPAGEVKRFCKLEFGVPILRAKDAGFHRFWSTVEKNYDYKQQLYMMRFVRVTSEMNTEQLSQYLDAIQKHYADRDVDPVLLTFPQEVAA